jgi:hypothetical protein
MTLVLGPQLQYLAGVRCVLRHTCDKNERNTRSMPWAPGTIPVLVILCVIVLPDIYARAQVWGIWMGPHD